MKKIVLIACSNKKLRHPAAAMDLYASQLFRLSLRYARSLRPNAIFILSARYGLVPLGKCIRPYDRTLNRMTRKIRLEWARKVIRQLRRETDLGRDKFIFLAGKRHRELLNSSLRHYKIPLAGLGIGRQLAYLKNAIRGERVKCRKLHEWLNALPKSRFPFDDNRIPANGIYILFEKGESAHGTSRIVRVGTHIGENQLLSRLNQHFAVPNKDRSIFRKNIGRSILYKRRDYGFLKFWNLDFTSRRSREKFYRAAAFRKQALVEKAISSFLRENFSFVTFPVDERRVRLSLESKIISTVSLCGECSASPHWLGRYSPVEKIRKSGLWLVNELQKTPLTDLDMLRLRKLLSGQKSV